METFMKTDRIVNLSRRRFLAAGVAAGAGLTLGVLPEAAQTAMGQSGPGIAGSAPAENLSMCGCRKI